MVISKGFPGLGFLPISGFRCGFGKSVPYTILIKNMLLSESSAFKTKRGRLDGDPGKFCWFSGSVRVVARHLVHDHVLDLIRWHVNLDVHDIITLENLNVLWVHKGHVLPGDLVFEHAAGAVIGLDDAFPLVGVVWGFCGNPLADAEENHDGSDCEQAGDEYFGFHDRISFSGRALPDPFV